MEVKDGFEQLTEAGFFFVTISGGESFLWADLFDLLVHAHALTFNVKLKTNGILIGEKDVARLRKLIMEGKRRDHQGVRRWPTSWARRLWWILLVMFTLCGYCKSHSRTT